MGPTPQCSDTCGRAGDGGCDDGGPGSDHSACEASTDCTDCGPRSGCSDTCAYAGDEVCDDGGAGADYDECAMGTDCRDCGGRASDLSLCTSCPLECNQRGAALRQESWCTESMWGDNGKCDQACNNAECQHDAGECSTKEAVDECKPLQEAKASSLTTAPASNTSYRILAGAGRSGKTRLEFNIVSMMPLRIALDTATNQWSLTNTGLSITLRWSDPRLADAPCRAQLREMLSFSAGASKEDRGEREAYRALLWSPTIALNQTTVAYRLDKTAGVQLESAAFDYLPGGGTGLSTSQRATEWECTDCVQLNLTFTSQIEFNPGLEFVNYPFDRQEFRMRFSFGKDVDVFTCAELLSMSGSRLAALHAAKRLADILPTTNEYILDAEGVSTSHPRLSYADGTEYLDTSTCDIHIRVKRDTSIMYLKMLIPTILIVYIGLSSVLLSAADHAGDRAAIIGVSILIAMTNLQADQGLGKLAYSTWFDVFNLLQIGVQVVAVFEVYVEHKLVHRGFEDEALKVNAVWAWASMAGFYPLITTGTILFGDGQTTSALIVVAVLIPLVALLSVVEFYRRLSAGRRLRARCAKELSETPRSANNFPEVLRAAFEAFDLDHSSSLDMAEIRKLLEAMFDRDRTLFTSAMGFAREIAAASSNGSLALEDLHDVLERLNMPEGFTRTTDICTSLRRSLTRRLDRSSYSTSSIPRFGQFSIRRRTKQGQQGSTTSALSTFVVPTASIEVM